MAYEVHAYHGFYVTINFYALHDHQVTGQVVGRLAGFHQSTIRDCSWHPLSPNLVSSSWDGKILEWEHLHGDKDDKRYVRRKQGAYSMYSGMDEYMSD